MDRWGVDKACSLLLSPFTVSKRERGGINLPESRMDPHGKAFLFQSGRVATVGVHTGYGEGPVPD